MDRQGGNKNVVLFGIKYWHFACSHYTELIPYYCCVWSFKLFIFSIDFWEWQSTRGICQAIHCCHISSYCVVHRFGLTCVLRRERLAIYISVCLTFIQNGWLLLGRWLADNNLRLLGSWLCHWTNTEVAGYWDCSADYVEWLAAVGCPVMLSQSR